MKNAFAIVALVSGLPAASLAAGPPPVPAGLLACAKIEDVGERVRCYDAQVAAMQGAAVATPSAPGSAAAASSAPPRAVAPAVTTAPEPVHAAPEPLRAAPAPAAVASHGASAAHFGEELLPPSERPASSRKEEALVSRISGMRKVGANIFIISLANGQVWRQDGSQIPLFFRVGDPVRIERHVLGSYHLSTTRTGSKNWVYVTRIR
ncbi:MAG: hypothetical protein ACREUG_01100 [Steroidobacteraceae bacterium]